MNDISQVVTRFAPSPTGLMHVGSARTALFNYLFAKQHGGKFILRIEDTDKERGTKEYEKDILDGLSWLRLSYDESYRQSERTDIYRKYLRNMITNGSAYEAEENKDGTGKIIRFKNPGTKVSFKDIVRGDIEFDTEELGDFVIAKDLNTPLYHVAVVVDDHEMGVTHIIRGEDHISNTPRQMLIQRAIGAKTPQYAHIPLILAPDKSKLSKRHGAVSVNEYKKMGYLPEALVNFLAFLGWNPGDEREVFTMDELVKEFSLKKVQKGGAVFNTDKLDWINKSHMKAQEHESMKTIEQKLLQIFGEKFGERINKMTPIVSERINKWGDIDEMAKKGEWSYFFEEPQYDMEKLIWKKSTKEKTAQHLSKLLELLKDADFSGADSIKKTVWNYAEEEGRGDVLWPMRYALSGQDKSPDPFTVASVLGKEETLKRLGDALKKLS